jgi:geranylgeranyl reductase family protein
MYHDAIIVGAGPAGCAAAHDLASNGHSVLLVDKREFPREKACGGGLTVKTLRSLRYSVAPVIRHVSHDLAVGDRTNRTVVFPSPYPICAMVVRSEFDEYCLTRARAGGAEFRVVPKVLDISERESHVELDTSDGAYRARFIVGADGANSRVRGLCSLFPRIKKGFALAARVPLDGLPVPRMEFDFGVVESGYGWMFPKDDHINVGIYTTSCREPLRRENLCDYVEAKLGIQQVYDTRGGHLGMGGWKYTPDSQRVFLAGDAAGFVDPLLGEGIHNAVRSGQMVAKAISESIHTGKAAAKLYNAQLRPLKRDLLSCHRSAAWFYQYPRFGYKALILPWTRRSLMKGFAAGLGLRDTKRLCWLLPLMRVSPLGPLVPSRGINDRAPSR